MRGKFIKLISFTKLNSAKSKSRNGPQNCIYIVKKNILGNCESRMKVDWLKIIVNIQSKLFNLFYTKNIQ